MNSTAGKRVPGAQVASEGGKTPAPVPKSDLHLSDSKPKSFKIKIAKDATSNAGSDQEGSVKGAKGSKTSKTTKKRKAEDTPGAKKAPSKSAKTTEKKDKNKKKVETKPKGPVNVEKQCGVPLPQGGLCARSLTCKSHSMGSKRAVTGRSQPYDILLAQYQKKNHAKLSMSRSIVIMLI